MSDTTGLTVGYVVVTALYLGYWISLRIRLARIERRLGKAK